MKRYDQLPFSQKIKWRNRLLWCVFVLMLVYMVVIGEMGGGDSRIMTPLADRFSRIGFFGGMGWVLWRIARNKKLLRDRGALREKQLEERDERRRYLHDKSGGIVMDVLLILLLCVTVTAAMFDMTAFYTAYAILCAAVVLKLAAWLIFSRRA